MTGPQDPYPSEPYPSNPNQYGGYQQQPPPSPKNGLGIAALVLGILSIIAFWSFGFGIVMGIAAVVLGFLGRSRVKKGTATNGGMSVTGIVLGIVGIIVGAAFLAITVWFVKESGFSDLTSCLSDAGGNEAAVTQCQDEFQSNIENRFDITVTPFPTP